MSLQTFTPVGRLVQGHPLEEQTKDSEGKPLVDKNGSPRVQYFFALAVEKTNPDLPRFLAELQKEASEGFRNNEPSRPDFAWKIVDGDRPENAGKAGFPGHYVIRLSSGFPIQCYTLGGASMITEKEAIKRGYYLRAFVNINANGDSRKPGLYVNPQVVELVAYGPVINTGPDGAKIFGSAPVTYIPSGASSTPPVSESTPASAAPASAAPASAAPAFAAPAFAAPVAPAFDFLKR